MSNENIDTLKISQDAARETKGAGSDGLHALSHAREEMYFRNKDAELIKKLHEKDGGKKSDSVQDTTKSSIK
ncbi:MAG: hypothetical protein IAF58_20445 [Leptolyngbya sp.]|nr:hypothetical protein [Candidatus Melainabacteria bacterium]